MDSILATDMSFLNIIQCNSFMCVFVTKFSTTQADLTNFQVLLRKIAVSVPRVVV